MKNARIERFGDQTILTRGWMRRAVPLPFLLRVTAAAVFAAACGSTGGGGSRQGRESRSPRRSAKFAPAGRGRTVDLGPAGCGFWALRERGGAGGGDCSLVPEDASSVSNHVRVLHVCVCCEHVHEVSLTQGIRQREKGEEETSEDEQAESGQAMLRPTRRPREVPGRIDQFCDPAAAETDHAGGVGPGQQLSRAQSGWDDQAGAKDKRDLWRGGTFSRPLGALGAVAVPDEQARVILDLATWSSTGSGSQTDVGSPSVHSEEAALPAGVAVPASAQASAGSQANRNLVDARLPEMSGGAVHDSRVSRKSLPEMARRVLKRSAAAAAEGQTDEDEEGVALDLSSSCSTTSAPVKPHPASLAGLDSGRAADKKGHGDNKRSDGKRPRVGAQVQDAMVSSRACHVEVGGADGAALASKDGTEHANASLAASKVTLRHLASGNVTRCLVADAGGEGQHGTTTPGHTRTLASASAEAGGGGAGGGGAGEDGGGARNRSTERGRRPMWWEGADMMGATGAAAMAGKSLQGYDSELESESLCFSLLPDELNYNQLTWAQIPDGPRGQAARLDNATMPQRLKVGKVYPGPPQRLAEYGIGGAVEEDDWDGASHEARMVGAHKANDAFQGKQRREARGGWQQGWRPAKASCIQVPGEKCRASFLTGAAEHGGLPEALKRGGGAHGREPLHIRAGHHFVQPGGKVDVPLTVAEGRNLSIFADYGAHVWGRWSLMEGSRGVFGGVSLLSCVKSQFASHPVLFFCGAGPWSLQLCTVLSVFGTPLLLACAPPALNPEPSSSAEKSSHGVSVCTRARGSHVRVEYSWVGGLGSKVAQRAHHGVVVLGTSSCLLLSSTVSDTGHDLGTAILGCDQARVKIKHSCIQRSRQALGLKGQARCMAMFSLFQGNKRSLLPAPERSEAAASHTEAGLKRARRTLDQTAPAGAGCPSLWLVGNRFCQGYNETMWWRHKESPVHTPAASSCTDYDGQLSANSRSGPVARGSAGALDFWWVEQDNSVLASNSAVNVGSPWFPLLHVEGSKKALVRLEALAANADLCLSSSRGPQDPSKASTTTATHAHLKQDQSTRRAPEVVVTSSPQAADANGSLPAAAQCAQEAREGRPSATAINNAPHVTQAPAPHAIDIPTHPSIPTPRSESAEGGGVDGGVDEENSQEQLLKSSTLGRELLRLFPRHSRPKQTILPQSGAPAGAWTRTSMPTIMKIALALTATTADEEPGWYPRSSQPSWTSSVSHAGLSQPYWAIQGQDFARPGPPALPLAARLPYSQLGVNANQANLVGRQVPGEWVMHKPEPSWRRPLSTPQELPAGLAHAQRLASASTLLPSAHTSSKPLPQSRFSLTASPYAPARTVQGVGLPSGEQSGGGSIASVDGHQEAVRRSGPPRGAPSALISAQVDEECHRIFKEMLAALPPDDKTRLVGMGMPLVHDALKRSTSESPLELHSATRLKEHDANSSSIHLPPAVLEPKPGPMEHATPKPDRVGHLASFVGGDEVDVNRFGACLVTLCRQYCPGLEQPLRLYSLGTAANTLYYLHAPEQAELAAPSGCPARSATAPAGDGQGRQDDTSYLSTPQAFLTPASRPVPAPHAFSYAHVTALGVSMIPSQQAEDEERRIAGPGMSHAYKDAYSSAYPQPGWGDAEVSTSVRGVRSGMFASESGCHGSMEEARGIFGSGMLAASTASPMAPLGTGIDASFAFGATPGGWDGGLTSDKRAQEHLGLLKARRQALFEQLHAAVPSQHKAILQAACNAVFVAQPPRMRREQFAYMTLTLCRHYAPNLEAPFKVYVFNLDPKSSTP